MSTSTTPAFTFVTPQVILARNAGALYNYGLGNALMTSLASSTDLNGLLNSVYVNSIGTTATSVVASNLVRNLGITGAAAVTEAEAYVVAQLNPVAVSGRGVVINNILTAFSNLTGNATFGSFASAFNTQVASAVNYAATPGARDTDWAGAIRVTGQTFTLTAGVDNVTGTSSGDTFDGSVNANGTATLTSVDQIDGAGGTDSLIAGLAAGTIAPTLRNIESAEFIAAGGSVIDLINTTGMNSVLVRNSNGLLTLKNIA